MKKDDSIFIDHILESIELIEGYAKGATLEDFLLSSQMQDAVIRRIEIIGEAVKNISADFKKKHPDIPWKEIAGMRDIVAHEYFAVDMHLAWKVAKRDIKELKKKLTRKNHL